MGPARYSPAPSRAAHRPRTRSMDKASAGMDEEEAMQQVDETGNVPLSSFSLSAPTQQAMVEMGISHLFPIQVRTYSHINKGRDVIGRARTGCGKTLAFVLPLVERILASGRELLRGRSPVVVCLAPTRELARQVAEVFQKAAPGLSTTCVYGGASYGMQESAMRRGIDIVVGTPGRTIDHIDRGTLRLDNIRFIVLDEADRMLDMGCVTAAALPLPTRDAALTAVCAAPKVPGGYGEGVQGGDAEQQGWPQRHAPDAALQRHGAVLGQGGVAQVHEQGCGHGGPGGERRHAGLH